MNNNGLMKWFSLMWIGLWLATGSSSGDDLVPGLQNMGIYGGMATRIIAANAGPETTRLYVSFENPNSAFYTDLDHPVAGDPFAPEQEVRFRMVPGLAADQNRWIPTHIDVHENSLRLFANVAAGERTISSFSVDPQDAVQEIDDRPPAGPDQNRSAFPGALLVHGQTLAYTLALNAHTNHTFEVRLRTIDEVSGWADAQTNQSVRLDHYPLFDPNQPSFGHPVEMAVCPATEKLYMLAFPADNGHTLFGKLLVSTGTIHQIRTDDNWATQFDAQDVPATVRDHWLVAGPTRWPVRLGVAPDARVFLLGLNGEPQTIRAVYSDDHGLSWSAEVDTQVQQGYLGPQVAFLPEGDDGNYFVYTSSAVSTNRGVAGSWLMYGYGMHAPCADPHAPAMLYTTADELGLGYSTNALTFSTSTNHNDEIWLDIEPATYSYGIEAVTIYDFDFTPDKTVGWTASGQGLRWTTNLNAAAQDIVWSAPLHVGTAPLAVYHAVAIDPNDPTGNTVYAGDNRNVYRSTNALSESIDSWHTVLRSGTRHSDPAGYDMGTLRRIAVKPGDTNVIAVGFQRWWENDLDVNGLMYSEDYGVSWTNMLFNGNERLCDIRDLLFVDGQLFVAASYVEAYGQNSGVFRIDTGNEWTLHHEVTGPFNARSLTVDQDGHVYAAGTVVDGMSRAPQVWRRDPATGIWSGLGLDGVPDDPGPAQPENVFVTIAHDGAGPLLLTYGNGFYVQREDGWVRPFLYPLQTSLQVVKWDELTLGSGSGLYAQETGNLNGNVYYVSLTGSNTPPYDSWDTAAHVIQDALDLASGGDLVWVAAGTYTQGGWNIRGLDTRVFVPDYVTLRSAHGPQVTIIQGAAGTGEHAPYGPDAVRGAYVAPYGVLDGFTITGGHTDFALMEEDEDDEDGDEGHLIGGGVLIWGGTVQHCLIVSNRAMMGGGVFIDGDYPHAEPGHIQRSVIAQNQAANSGGGAFILDDGLISHCAIAENTAAWGAGALLDYGGHLANVLITGNHSLHLENDGSAILFADGGTAVNCTIFGNLATAPGGYAVRGFAEDEEEGDGDPGPAGHLLNSIVWGNMDGLAAFRNVLVDSLESVQFSCAPELIAGAGNLTDDPQFVDAAALNFRLQGTSPCIDAGTNDLWMVDAEDLQGNPRIFGDTVDMGAYEWPQYILRYTAGPGGTIDGHPEVVRGVNEGETADPVTAQPDAGAAFSIWSDAVDEAERIDALVQQHIDVLAHFVTAGGAGSVPVPIDWYVLHGLAPQDGDTWADLNAVASASGQPNWRVYVADGDPNDADSYLQVGQLVPGEVGIATIQFDSSPARNYTLQSATDLHTADWTDVPGTGPRPGTGAGDTMTDPTIPPAGSFYRIKVDVP
jgi:hypothetical protein